jgi:hypothetical protein
MSSWRNEVPYSKTSAAILPPFDPASSTRDLADEISASIAALRLEF